MSTAAMRLGQERASPALPNGNLYARVICAVIGVCQMRAPTVIKGTCSGTAAKEEHMAIVHLAERAEAVAGAVDLSAAKTFQAARTLVDRALEADGVAAELAVAVNRILPTVDVAALV